MVANCLEDSTTYELFAFLIEVLKKELAINTDLKNFLIDEKRLILTAAPLQQLNDNNAVKENLILKCRILDEGRTNIIKKIARTLDLNDRDVRLMSLMNYAALEQRQAIDDLKNKLTSIASDIKKINDENIYLLSTSVSAIKGSIEFISTLVNRSGVYLDNGKIGEVKRNGSLLRTEG